MFKAFIISFLFLLISTISFGQPTFKGGSAAMYNFLSQKIIYPEYSKQNCISGIIKVGFRLDINGNVIDAAIQQGLGIDLDDEALRVVKLTSGKWIVPADYNSALIVLPVRFQLDPAHCSSVSGTDINLAIVAYKQRQQLQDAITDYYIAKYQGKANGNREAYIINLKKQLGFDEDYINSVLDEAQQKLQQGDKAGACHNWLFIRNIGSNKADEFLAKYCINYK